MGIRRHRVRACRSRCVRPTAEDGSARCRSRDYLGRSDRVRNDVPYRSTDLSVRNLCIEFSDRSHPGGAVCKVRRRVMPRQEELLIETGPHSQEAPAREMLENSMTSGGRLAATNADIEGSARSRTRTGTALRPRDFKSLASTDFATRAWCGAPSAGGAAILSQIRQKARH